MGLRVPILKMKFSSELLCLSELPCCREILTATYSLALTQVASKIYIVVMTNIKCNACRTDDKEERTDLILVTDIMRDSCLPLTVAPSLEP